MNDFLRHRYEESRQVFLENLAWMNRQNDEFAEQNGGADNLPDDKRKIYEGRRKRLIRLVAFHDNAQEYVEDLHDWIANLIRENRNLADQLRTAREGWLQYFPNITNPNQTESHREHRRQMREIQLRIEMPNLF